MKPEVLLDPQSLSNLLPLQPLSVAIRTTSWDFPGGPAG